MNDCIPVLVEADPELNMRGASDAVGRVVDVTAEVLKRRIGDLARIMSDAAATAPADAAFEVSELRFTLHVDANGEVSVMSLAKGAVTAGAGIEVTLRKRGASAA